MTSTAIITIAHGRHQHLRRQRQWIARMAPQPSRHIVVAMGDPGIAGVTAEEPAVPTTVVELPAAEELPLAAARNAGVVEAVRIGARQVVLLDVDCLPEPDLVAAYDRLLAEVSDPAYPQVVTGRVRYLPEGLSDEDHASLDRLIAAGRDHAARPLPPPGELLAGDPRLLWSLNMALTVPDWQMIGGFDERYVGYGGEDTDFGQRVAAAGGTVWWTREAGAFHQHHPVSSPPVQHARSIARNANLFRRTWGFDPMEGWLREMEAMGVLMREDDGWAEAPPR